MAYNQIYGIINSATEQALGASAVQAIDTSTFVQVGGQLLSDNNPFTLETFMNSLCGVIRETRIKSKVYNPLTRIKAYRDAENFGLYIRKIQRSNIQDVVENSSYKALDWDYYDGALTNNWSDRIFGEIGGLETDKIIIAKKHATKINNLTKNNHTIKEKTKLLGGLRK